MTSNTKYEQEQISKTIICLSLDKITFSKDVNTIDDTIFNQNTNFRFHLIKQIMIPSNIQNIDIKILTKFNLKTITVDKNNTHYSTKENI